MKLRHALVALLRLNLECLEEDGLRRLADRNAQRARRGEGIVIEPVDRLRRDFAGDGVVEGRGHGVDVGEGPLPPAARVLLHGGETVLQDHVEALALLSGTVARGAEVDELGRSARLHDDVVGRDVTVDDALGVHPPEGVHQRQQEGSGLLHTEAPRSAAHVFVERDAVHILHHEVCGGVLLKIAVDADDVRIPDELGQGLGLFEEALHAVFKVLPPLAGVDLHRGASGDPARKVRGQVFLDGDAVAGLVVEGDVGDAEAALAQHAPDGVAPVEDGAGAQGERVAVRLIPPVKAAVRAGAVRVHFAETVPAQHAAPLLPPAEQKRSQIINIIIAQKGNQYNRKNKPRVSRAASTY